MGNTGIAWMFGCYLTDLSRFPHKRLQGSVDKVCCLKNCNNLALEPQEETGYIPMRRHLNNN